MFSKHIKIPKKPKLSVVIVAYRSEKMLFECLHSLSLALDVMAYEVIIVRNDDTSSKNTREFPHVREICTGKNIGFGTAANRGARNARSNHILFLNPDTRLLSPTLGAGFAFLSEETPLVGLGLLSSNFKPQMWSVGKETHFIDIIGNNIGLSRSRRVWKSAEPIAADWVSGAALLVRKKNFLDICGFDEDFFLYFEDMDMCRRLRAKKKSIMFVPSVRVFHEGGVSFQSIAEQKKYYYASQLVYFKKHRSALEYTLLLILQKILRK